MRRSENFVVIAGNVGGIKVSETTAKVPAVSFWVASDKGSTTTFVRVSAYGELAKICAEGKLEKGGFVVVIGELFNRKTSEGKITTEVKAHKILFLSKK